MSIRLKPLPSAPRWEKQGNTIWVSCRACKGWFPVEGELLEDDGIDLKCPHCADTFPASESAKVIQP